MAVVEEVYSPLELLERFLDQFSECSQELAA